MTEILDAFIGQIRSSGVQLQPLADDRILREAVGLATPKPQHVAQPARLDELKAVLGAARQHGVNLWIACNAAGNGLRVGANPGASVLLDLSNLRSIVAVDPVSAYALVEPGVSYAQLVESLEKKGLKFWIDCGRDADESILGGICERSYGYTAYGDRLMMQCGMEVMLPDGDLLRTGMGALPGENTWQLFKYGFGPYADGIFTQSSFAVPTKVGFWISPEPPCYRPFALRIKSDQAYAAAMDLVRMLRITMTVPNTIVATDQLTEQMILGATDAAPWNVFGALYGLPKNVEISWKMLTDMSGKLNETEIEDLGGHGLPTSALDRSALMCGKPSTGWKSFQVKTAGRYIRIVFALPIDGPLSSDFVRRSRQLNNQSGCQLLIEQATSWRALLAETLIVFEAGGEEAAVTLGRRLISYWGKEGIGVVRTNPALLPDALASYSSGGLRQLEQRIAGVLA